MATCGYARSIERANRAQIEGPFGLASRERFTFSNLKTQPKGLPMRSDFRKFTDSRKSFWNHVVPQISTDSPPKLPTLPLFTNITLRFYLPRALFPSSQPARASRRRRLLPSPLDPPLGSPPAAAAPGSIPAAAPGPLPPPPRWSSHAAALGCPAAPAPVSMAG
jgi:hypothetical protein